MIDADGDGAAAYPEDLGCADAFAQTESPACQDAEDNEGDGFVDYPDDPGCDTPSDSDETSAALVCDNLLDDDGDGLPDWQDPGCMDPEDPSERCEWGDPWCTECDDGLNNETEPGFYPQAYSRIYIDHAVDYPDDQQCWDVWDLSEKPDCWDQRDNDGDGYIDAVNSGKPVGDPECYGNETQQREDPETSPYTAPGGSANTCGLGFELAFLIPLLMVARKRRHTRLLLLCFAVLSIPMPANARTASSVGVLMNHMGYEVAVMPMGLVEAFQSPTWLGWRHPKWTRWTPGTVVVGSLLVANHALGALWNLSAVVVETVTFSSTKFRGKAVPYHPDPRWTVMPRDWLMPKCEWRPWADSAPRCLKR